MAVAWVLIILWHAGSSAALSVRFEDEASCVFARNRIKAEFKYMHVECYPAATEKTL